MPLNLQDIIKLGLVGSGSGGGSSGGGGGGSAAVSPKEVNFYDYDGTCVHAYTVAEAQALSALPAGPEHPGLVFQGWNWSLEGVKGLTRAMNIGAMYTTDDGTTRLYITLQEGRTSPMLGVRVSGTVTVDWGDGTEPDVLEDASGNLKWTPNHDYAAPGDYVIKLAVNGQMQINGSSTAGQNSSLLRKTKSTDYTNNVYHNAIKKLEIGNNVTGFTQYALASCAGLESVSVPDGIVEFGKSVINGTYNLKCFVVPKSVASVPEGGLGYSYGLRTAILPDTITSIGNNLLYNCKSLISLTLPDGIEKINTYALGLCDKITTIEIPKTVTEIQDMAFNGCQGMACFDFTACTTVPSLAATSAFNNIPADCEIRVPAALYDEWIAATNWATYASQIVAY